MYVLGLGGSPREGGNTDLLLERALAGAAQAGAQVEKVILNRLHLTPCQHCDGCRQTGQCIIEDDLQGLYPKLKKAEGLILASPIFFLGVTAQTKILIDRCQAFWAAKYLLGHRWRTRDGQPRRGLFISVSAHPCPDHFPPAIATVKAFFATLDVIYAEELLFPGVGEKGAIVRHPTALQEAFAAGQRLVTGIQDAGGKRSHKP
ncbi:MAG TPA: flavodoxin family protein [Armatimonadetes bacterium]|nr:flavodoxin family protein [Armatimonadota bacterium]